ncbi:hypothetical protein KY285_007687 [Solanum tuberosum]|nr:hypothetical protein KY285_007687 [Solanum tuberosum]
MDCEVDMVRQAIEILGRRLNWVDDKFKTLKDFTLEENDNIHKEMEVHKHADYEMKEIITFLGCRLMDALSTIETMKIEIEALKGGIKAGGFVTSNADREVKIEAPKPPMFKGNRDAQEVYNFLWHLENYLKCNKETREQN